MSSRQSLKLTLDVRSYAMAKLRHKKKQHTRLKYLTRVQTRAIHSKRWYYRLARVIFTLTILALIYLGCNTASKMMRKYKSTSKWVVTQRVKMSEMRPFMLTLNDHDYALANKMMQAKLRIWDGNDFLKSAKQSDIDEFNELFKSLKVTDESLTSFKQTVIDTYWPIKQDMSRLITSNGSINGTMTDVAKQIESTAKLSGAYQTASDNSFVANTINSSSKLVSDFNNLTAFLNSFKSLTNNDMLITDATSADITTSFNYLSSMNYTWPAVSKIQNKLASINTLAKSQDDKRDKYAKYLASKEAETAFNEYAVRYKSSIDFINANKVTLIKLKDSKLVDIEKWAKSNDVYLVKNYVSGQVYNDDTVVNSSIDSSKYSYVLKRSIITLDVVRKTSQTSSSSSSTTPTRPAYETERGGSTSSTNQSSTSEDAQ